MRTEIIIIGRTFKFSLTGLASDTNCLAFRRIPIGSKTTSKELRPLGEQTPSPCLRFRPELPLPSCRKHLQRIDFVLLSHHLTLVRERLAEYRQIVIVPQLIRQLLGLCRQHLHRCRP